MAAEGSSEKQSWTSWLIVREICEHSYSWQPLLPCGYSLVSKAVNAAHQGLSSAFQGFSLFCIPGHAIHKPFSSDRDDLPQAVSKCEQDFMQQGWSPSLANRSNCWHLPREDEKALQFCCCLCSWKQLLFIPHFGASTAGETGVEAQQRFCSQYSSTLKK